ncbi:shikimate dehydrogenase (NADP(+)) [Devosia pacifica]|uniref:Shikimate dehydrogenase (NADP(+)) n=1 Tax=Devosia pacifica TaxID=1335967 RepID=A0A918S609_9HYPH|nr:shikimate dehydrogenase [Devosia pacifica]GHA23381.1 shikimate dehydrogenase (NADP(+)) [Devosia pacifica]
MTRKAFVIGHPIAHSRSPLIHGTWITQYGIDGSYEPFDVSPDDLPLFFERLKTGEFAGGNVTIPHKEAVFALCDTLDPLAETIGAANTLVRQPDGRVHGTNTDYLGFLGNLDANAQGWSEGLDTAIVLGAGGAARAILVALKARGISRVHVLNRTKATARRLAEAIDGPFHPGGLEYFTEIAGAAGLVVNTTSVGMHGTAFDTLDLSVLPKTATVTDLVYVPRRTPLLIEAEQQGLRTVDGLGMLLHQAVPGFTAWFGVEPEVSDTLRRRVEQTLEH